MKNILFITNHTPSQNNHPQQSNQRWFKKNPRKALILVFLSLLFSIFLIAEIGFRIYKNEFRLINFQAEGINILKSYYPAKFDQLLGYIPKERNPVAKDTLSTEKVTIIRDGIRSNDNDLIPGNAPRRTVILAVGDSLTFGDEVSNNETWPAYLEKITRATVLNGGVFGYGLDQTVLRAEDLIKKYKPNILIVSFIKDDLNRCGLKVRTNIPKPYFIIKDNELQLITSHLSEDKIAQLEQKNLFTRVFGYSLLIHNLMSEYVPLYWFQGAFRYEEKSGEDYRKIAARLMVRLSRIAQETCTKVIIMPQYGFAETPQTIKELNHFKKVAAASGLEVVDLFDKITAIKVTAPQTFQDMYVRKGHMSPAGNSWVAAELAQQLYLKNYLR